MEEELKLEDMQLRKDLRREFSSIGWALLIYLLILNACVTLGAIVDMVFISLRAGNGEVFTEDQVNAILMSNGWGYLATIAIGLIALRLWKGKEFCSKTLWTPSRPMNLVDFLCLLCMFLCGQAAFQMIASSIESLLNRFGLTALGDIQAATMSVDTLSMWLYSCIGAPIAEELLFRGVVLRKLEPYGKRFAIVMSAVMFGVFHANLVQVPYAILVGLVLGYVALEYNILWAMVLHMINNLVLGDLLDRLTSDTLGNALTVLIVWGSALAALIVQHIRWKEATAYRRENPVGSREVRAFLTSPGVIAVLIYAVVTIVSNLISYNF